jgi:hypothetical protein
MNEESILKQSLLFTGKLVGIVAVWVALLSVTMVAVTSRVVGSLSGSSADKANVVEVDSRANSRTNASRLTPKPNG